MNNRKHSKLRATITLLSGLAVLVAFGFQIAYARGTIQDFWHAATTSNASEFGSANENDATSQVQNPSAAQRVKVPPHTQQVVCPTLPTKSGSTVLWASEEDADPEAKYFQNQKEGQVVLNTAVDGVAHSFFRIINNTAGGTVVAKPVGNSNPQVLGTVTGLGSDKQVGVFANNCASSSSSAFYLVGSTQVGNQNTLTLVNPQTAAVDVKIQAWSESGAIPGTKSAHLNPGEKTELLLDALFGENQRLGIRVTATGSGVVSFVTSQTMEGAKPMGAAARVPLATPSKKTVIPAAYFSENTTLQVLNPSEHASKLKISLISTTGAKPLAQSDKLQVAAGAIAQLPIVTPSSDWESVLIEAEQPVTAQAFDQLKDSKSRSVIVSYPALDSGKSGQIPVGQKQVSVVVYAPYDTKVRFASGNDKRDATIRANHRQVVKLPRGLWQWKADRVVNLGVAIIGIDTKVTPVLSGAKTLSQISETEVYPLP